MPFLTYECPFCYYCLDMERSINVGLVLVNSNLPIAAQACLRDVGRCVDGKRYVPVQMLDVAGLVPGASEGLVRILGS